MEALRTKIAKKNSNQIKVKTLPVKPTKKSVGELIMQNIPDGKYEGLSKILESYEK